MHDRIPSASIPGASIPGASREARSSGGLRGAPTDLSSRQADVLRVVVRAYLGDAGPIGSATISHLLPVPLSSASVRNTLAELAELSLVEKPHASSGRVPTDLGVRVFVDELLDGLEGERPSGELGDYERRSIAYEVDEAGAESVLHVASQLLSQRTRQLGFAVTPSLERVVLAHVSLVRLSREKLLVVLVSQAGDAHRRILDDLPERARPLGQAGLDRIASLLNERVAGRTLREVRDLLAREAGSLRHEADEILSRALEIGARAVASPLDEPRDLVIETRLTLLDQPEFQDPRRVRDLFEALEEKERLLEILDQMLESGRVRVILGDEVGEPGLRRCALVASGYGGDGPGPEPLGAVGVIGPTRMDFARVIPLVGYLSRVMTEKLNA